MKIDDKIQSCDKETLLTLVTELAYLSDKNMTYVERALSPRSANQVKQRLLKEIKDIQSLPCHLDYNDTSEVAEQVDAVVDDVKKYLLVNSPDDAITILKSLIAIDSKLFEVFDDSYGELGTSYSMLFEVLDEAFSRSSDAPEAISNYIEVTH